MCQAHSDSGSASPSGFGSECLPHSFTCTHMDADNSHTPWRTTAPRPPSPRALCPRPASSEPALAEPALRKARSRGAAESARPGLAGHRACGRPESGVRPGVGAGRGLPSPAGVARAPSRPRCTHPRLRWALTGSAAWEGSARKSETSGDRGHLLLGRC